MIDQFLTTYDCIVEQAYDQRFCDPVDWKESFKKKKKLSTMIDYIDENETYGDPRRNR